MNTLHELLGDIADRGRPGELAQPALQLAHRMRVRRRLLTAATGVAALILVLTPLASRGFSSGPPALPGSSALPGSWSHPASSGPSWAPDELPGGWTWGGGQDGRGNTFVFNRAQSGLEELPYDASIPAPTGDLVYVTNQDGWAGILDLKANAIKPLQHAIGDVWSLGMPQWSADGTRLLSTNGYQLYLADALTGESHRVDLQGGCAMCGSVVWLPGETEVAIPVSAKESDGLQVYSIETGAKLRRVPWYRARLHGFSPDGRHVVANVDGRSAIVDVTTGTPVATIDAADTRTAYWAGPKQVLVIEQGGAALYSMQGKRIGLYPWPAGFNGVDLPNFSLVKVAMRP